MSDTERPEPSAALRNVQQVLVRDMLIEALFKVERANSRLERVPLLADAILDAATRIARQEVVAALRERDEKIAALRAEMDGLWNPKPESRQPERPVVASPVSPNMGSPAGRRGQEDAPATTVPSGAQEGARCTCRVSPFNGKDYRYAPCPVHPEPAPPVAPEEESAMRQYRGEVDHLNERWAAPEQRGEPSLAEVVAFLTGEAPMLDLWFGESHRGQEQYWWRTHLHAAADRVLSRETVEKAIVEEAAQGLNGFLGRLRARLGLSPSGGGE